MAEEIQLRVHGTNPQPALVYLPGLHGDWTLIGGFRRALGPSVRFVEVTYPRTLTWSLEDYARAAEASLLKAGLTGGWLLGESFGSQVLWQMLKRKVFRCEGAILAGGFGRHPTAWLAAALATMANQTSYPLFRFLFCVYAQISKIRFRRSPETVAALQEFLARRTLSDCHAAKHRLKLVAGNDPREIVRLTDVPLYTLRGWWDPIVPWTAARWLKSNCRSISGDRIIWRADHNVLATAPNLAAAQVLQWMSRPRASDLVLPKGQSPGSSPRAEKIRESGVPVSDNPTNTSGKKLHDDPAEQASLGLHLE